MSDNKFKKTTFIRTRNVYFIIAVKNIAITFVNEFCGFLFLILTLKYLITYTTDITLSSFKVSNIILIYNITNA